MSKDFADFAEFAYKNYYCPAFINFHCTKIVQSHRRHANSVLPALTEVAKGAKSNGRILRKYF